MWFELTRVVYTVQQFDRASADHSTHMNQKTRWERRQGEEGELLQIENPVTYSRGEHTLDFSQIIFADHV